jgi:hypothetical protein
MALLFMSVTFLFLGPSKLLNFPNTLPMMIIAMPLLGMTTAPILIGCIPEMLENLRVSFEIEEGKNEEIETLLNDKVNDVFGTGIAISSFIAPIAGSRLYTPYGNNITCDVVSGINFTMALVFLVFNCGLHPFKTNREFNKELEKYTTSDKKSQGQI